MKSFYSSWQIPTQFSSNNIGKNAIGIDLGTTRCCCAVSKNEKIDTIALDNIGQRLLPSYVAYDEENDKCGQVVVDRLRFYSQSTVFDVKRIIGKRFDEIVMDPAWTFLVETDDKDDCLIKTERCGEKKLFSPVEIAAVLLKHIKIKAEELQGRKLEKVVITVPAIFSIQQCRETIQAAFIAGWKSVKLLPEPVAAAFSYFIDQEIPKNLTMFLFDLGGGTLDICVFKTVNDRIEIISNNGDTKLGGRDFDNVLYEYFKEKLKSSYSIDTEKKKYKLLSECQKIKENLSKRCTDNLDIDEFDTTQEGIIQITRDEFKDLSQNLLEKIRNKIITALTYNDSEVDPTEIEKVLLVGGGSRMPMIQDLLHDVFPHAEQICQENPDEVVARGAAHFACHLLSDPQTQWITQKNIDENKTLSDIGSRESQNDDIILSVHQGPDEVVSQRTMESTASIHADGRIYGTTKLEAKHWIWGFRGGVRIDIYDEKENLLWESEWYFFGVNMHNDSVRGWWHTIPTEHRDKVKSAKIIHKHKYEIDGEWFNNFLY